MTVEGTTMRSRRCDSATGLPSPRIVVLVVLAFVAAGCAYTARVSQSSTGVIGDNTSQMPSTSADGGLVAFASTASNLVPGDSNGWSDVFVKDTVSGAIERVSVASDGTQGDGLSYQPAISGDGRWVVFSSIATNLVAVDSNPLFDVYLHDRTTGTTTLVSRDGFGGQLSGGSADQPDVSEDGSAVAFRWNPIGGTDQILRHDVASGVSETVSRGVNAQLEFEVGPADSRDPAISADGTLVSFQSLSTFPPLTSPGTSTSWNIFVAMEIEIPISGTDGWGALTVTTGNDSSTRPDVEGTALDPVAGTWTGAVVFESVATDLGVADPNGVKDVFLHRSFGSTASLELVSVDVADGAANGASRTASVSADYRWVGFASSATDLVSGDANGVDDVFVRDRTEGRTIRVSASQLGAEASGASRSPWLSADGRYVAFTTDATDIVGGDTNARSDVVLRHVVTPRIDTVSPAVVASGATTALLVTGDYLDLAPIIFDSDASATFGPASATSTPGEVTVEITVPAGAPGGVHDLFVLLDGGGLGSTGGAMGSCTDCLTIS